MELDDEEFDKLDISVSIENSIRLEFDPGDSDKGASIKFPIKLSGNYISIRNKFIFLCYNSLFVYDSRIYQLPLLPLELFDACLESVELVLFIFTFIPPPPELLLDEGIEFAGEAGILGDPGKEDDLKFCC